MADAPLWYRFEDLRDHLANQYRSPGWDDTTGLAGDELERAVDEALRAHAHRSRVIQKAQATAVVLRRARIAIDPEDWFVDKVDHGSDRERDTDNCGGLVAGVSRRWLDEATRGEIAETSAWLDVARETGYASVPKGGLDRGHVSLGWDVMLSEGLTGLLRRVREARDALGERATPSQLDFYEAVGIVYGAAIDLAGRFAALARGLADRFPESRERLLIVADAMEVVPAHRPRTFHQALQFLWLMHELVEMEGERVRSMGQFDRTLYPFYRSDIDNGRLTQDQAKELVLFFWYKWYARTGGRHNGKNFCFGGQYADGSPIVNELTYLGMDAAEELATPDPKFSARLSPETPDEFYRRVAGLVRSGEHSFVLLNDPVAVGALVDKGIPVEDARTYLPIGCYEPAVEGKEIGCTMNITVNLAKSVELALSDGIDRLSGRRLGPSTGDPRAFTDFAQLRDATIGQLDAFLARAHGCIGAAEREWPVINPSPMLAGTFPSCIERGKDVGEGGPIYNGVGFVGAALANAADSLAAVKRTVYDERRFTMDELLDALAADFDGHESMRQYLLNRVPKWGNAEDEVDELAVAIADHFCTTVAAMRNERGGTCAPGLFSLDFALRGGRRTGALPDGRRAGESLAPGQGASYGRDANGVTSLMNSVSKLDGLATPNGAVLDVTLHPSAVAGEEGLDKMVAMIRSYFASGGYALQFNVLDPQTLRHAQEHPERYASLQVRVTGWSVYFTTMSTDEQNQYIRRIAHAC